MRKDNRLRVRDPGRIVDRLLAGSYFALALGGCGGTPGPVVPTGATPASPGDARTWVDSLRLDQPIVHRFRWLFQDRDGSAGGQGSARITPGDSLRFDVRGPLGTGRGAAFVVGDSARWADPEEEVRKLVPNYPLLWAMLGVVHFPDPAGEVSRYEDVRLTAWRFVRGEDTVEFARFRGPPTRLVADVRQGGRRLGRVETEFADDGSPRKSRLDVPGAPARLDINYVSTARTNGFPPDTWIPPAP